MLLCNSHVFGVIIIVVFITPILSRGARSHYHVGVIIIIIIVVIIITPILKRCSRSHSRVGVIIIIIIIIITPILS